MTDPFDRLHPSIQHHVVNSLGWHDLRPLQAAAIEPVVDGQNCLLLAPTAGGKTEAAVFPLLTRMSELGWPSLSALYLCPLRALINNLQPRLERYASFSGLRSAMWHGDVGPSERQRIVADPPNLLLTTPESLEAMLLSTRVDARWLLGQVRSVVIDEVHAFASDDRGWHLLALLARLQRIAGREFQRIGLSATVGNPAELLEWMTPGSDLSSIVVAPTADAVVEPHVEIDHVGRLENAATVISRLHRGEKRLVFIDSRARAEALTRALRERGTTTFITHASLSRDERRQAEHAFAEGDDCVIVATSALELGIDVGDLDRVVQIDAPSTVASFLQRMGRAGRRAGSSRNTLFLTTTPETLWRAAGICHLWNSGYVEPVVGPPLPVHILAHQLLALVLQEGSVGQRLWTEWLGDPMVLGGDVALLADAVAEHLTGHGFLTVDGGMLGIGREAERRFGRKNFLELTSVFTSPPVFAVLAGRREIGHVHDVGIWAAFQVREGPPTLLLGGDSWHILDIDWRRHVVHVELIDRGGKTGYRGSGPPLRRELCESIGSVLAGQPPGVSLSRRATEQLRDDRVGFVGARPGRASVVRHHPDGRAEWWTFAGLRANVELAARLGGLCRTAAPTDALAIRLVDGCTADQVRQAIDTATPVEQMLDLVNEMTEGLKFADCLPDWLADSELLSRMTDPGGVQAVLEAPVDSIHLS